MQLATHPKYRSAIALGLSLGCLSLIPATVSGQSVREREAIRRQGLVLEADNLLAEGRKAFAEGNYQEAVQKYRAALDTLPNGSATSARRREFTAHLSDGSVALSQQYRREGRYDDARSLLGDVLVADPTDHRAQTELDYIDDPIRTNPSLDYEHTKDVDKVRRHLYKGEGFYNLGKFDEAHEEFHAVLRVDPYNKAARRWQERVNAARSDYYRSAYDETRSRLLMEVDRAWEMAVPPEAGTGGGDPSLYSNNTSGSVYIQNKLKNIVIPSVDFEGITVEEAIDFLRQRSRELDTMELDPAKKGINFVIRKARIDAGGGGLDLDLDAEGGLTAGNPGEEKIPQLKLNNVPLSTVLTYICDQAKLRYKVDEYAVTLLPIGGGEGDDLLNRTWTVPPTFMNDISGSSSGEGGGNDDPFADNGGGGGTALAARPPLKTLLENNGITFPGDSSASYLSGTSSLVVRNTAANLDLVDALVERIIGTTPKMINIQSKFVEISQENTDELGFDWIINPISFGGEGLLGGGTIGSGTGRVGGDFTSVIGSGNETITGIGGATDPVTGIVTAGNRSGQGAISGNSIDALLNNPNRTAQTANVAPGILSVTGLFGSGEFQMIMRGLAQKKGTDIMAAPSVVTRPGQKATIEIIREFIYPTEYEPPELPNDVDSINTTILDPITGLPIVGGGGSAFPVTPATPTAFDMEPTGVTLEVEPNVGQNDYVIELRLAPQIVEFEGFINYGSPINAGDVVITENRIEMPVFATRRVTTGITIYDGHTVAIGGMMREDVQNVEDSVPILGDLPLIGRLFQSKAENHIKSNLIVFVTAQIIDATGQPIRSAPGTTTSSSVSDAVGVLPPRDGF